jgi:UDP-N-acetylmuramyl tripeptide synthase
VSEPFEDSRRLTGCNFYFAGTGAALEAAPGVAFDDGTVARWSDNIDAAREALGWPEAEVVVRRHRSGVSLAFAAPLDQLYAATEVNEWAWWSALREKGVRGSDESRDSAIESTRTSGDRVAAAAAPTGTTGCLHAPGSAAVWDRSSALRTLRMVAMSEATPALIVLQREAATRGLPFLPDDDEISIGAGDGSLAWPMDALPKAVDIDWRALHAIPVALVTGSNGKTTTVRLLAAMTRAHGWHTAHSCTDGVFFDGAALESGDFSGPTGARTALRQAHAQAAILETARGGMLRRGLALCRANAAVVTNVSADHFGEYGVHDLDDLGAVKLTVARAIGGDGLLVLNGDDTVLQRQSAALACPIGWFALDFDAPLLLAHRARGGASCGVREGRLLLSQDAVVHDLGAVEAMPLTMDGRAGYNVANIAGASLAATALGVEAQVIAATLARFGAGRDDNPGRLQHWRFGALDVYVDYAHNPDGLRELLRAVGADRRNGRLALILGHAGNREDDDLRAVAATAAVFHPDLVVLKDIGGYERGRASGEIAAIMRETLAGSGVAADAVETRLDEVEAARRPLQWARDGDLVVLPVHELDARAKVVALLDTLRSQDWRPGMPLPPLPPQDPAE